MLGVSPSSFVSQHEYPSLPPRHDLGARAATHDFTAAFIQYARSNMLTLARTCALDCVDVPREPLALDQPNHHDRSLALRFVSIAAFGASRFRSACACARGPWRPLVRSIALSSMPTTRSVLCSGERTCQPRCRFELCMRLVCVCVCIGMAIAGALHLRECCRC